MCYYTGFKVEPYFPIVMKASSISETEYIYGPEVCEILHTVASLR